MTMGLGGKEEVMDLLRDVSEEVIGRSGSTPGVGILAEERTLRLLRPGMDPRVDVPWMDLPRPPSMARARPGEVLSLGRLQGVDVALAAAPGWKTGGSEGAPPGTVLTVRLLGMLGVNTLVLTGTGVGLRQGWKAHDVVLVEDHINLLGDNPLVGENLDELGPRFPDMTCPYDPDLRQLALAAARAQGLGIHSGVLAAVASGVAVEESGRTRLRALGADVVGHGMVPEVIVARHMGLRVLGLCVLEGAEALAAGGRNDSASRDGPEPVPGSEGPEVLGNPLPDLVARIVATL